MAWVKWNSLIKIMKIFKTEIFWKPSKICTCSRVSQAEFYLYHSTKIAKARPGFDDRSEYPSVQVNSSSPCIVVVDIYRITRSTTSTFQKENIKFGKYTAFSFIFKVKGVSDLEVCMDHFVLPGRNCEKLKLWAC